MLKPTGSARILVTIPFTVYSTRFSTFHAESCFRNLHLKCIFPRPLQPSIRKSAGRLWERMHYWRGPKSILDTSVESYVVRKQSKNLEEVH